MLTRIIDRARRHGIVVVCSAGNDAIDRPAFPAALWSWTGSELGIAKDRRKAPASSRWAR